jgi:hypothetical protein
MRLDEKGLEAAARAVHASPAFQPAAGPWTSSSRVSEKQALAAAEAAALAYLSALKAEPAGWQWRKGTSNRHHPDQWEWTQWQPGRFPPSYVARAFVRLEERPLYLHPAATPTPATVSEEAERKFKRGDRVTKTKGSSWTGRVVGFYSTDLTPIGYCVESENEPGSVQIYPEAALAPAQPKMMSEAKKSARDRWPEPGDKMRFLNRNGYDSELEAARKVFNTSDTYTVRGFDLGSLSSRITFQGISGRWNSVMFDFEERETALAADGRG